MTDLKALKSTRGSIKGQMTKLHTYVSGTIDKTDVDGFQSKLARAKVLLKQFEDVEKSIFAIDPDHDSQMIDFTELYYVVEARLNRFIREYNVDNHDESQNIANNSLNLTTMHPVDVRLPKISIEPFSGQYTEWQSFYDLYVKTIHENANLSPAQKFQYLKGFLKGDAYSLLKHMSITESNYFEAFRKLCARYDRKKYTINAFIRSFMAQPTIHQANALNIRKMLDTSDEVIRGLKALGKDAELRDVWLIYIIEEKLDAETRALWAQKSCENDLPTLEDMFKFLLNRSDALETLRPSNTKRSSNQRVSKVFVTTDASCSLCDDDHEIACCNKFEQLSVLERRQCVKSGNRCFNCLKMNHPVFRCLSKSRCEECGKKHHTLLHINEVKEPSSTSFTDESNTLAAHANISMNCILPTALVTVCDQFGLEHECRVLLDSGSMSTFISEKLCNKLKLSRKHNRTIVSGISGSGNQVTKGMVTLTLTSRINAKTNIQVEALVMTKLCSNLPIQSFNSNLRNLNVKLADPNFNKSHGIDLILGVQHMFNVLMNGRIKNENKVIAIETIFGWVLGGELDAEKVVSTSSNIVQLKEKVRTEENRVDEMLQQFWEIETIPSIKRLTDDEEKCEKLFAETSQRNVKGRFIVELPMKQGNEHLGTSLSLALSRQRAMERRFQKDLSFKKLYVQFMEEYHQLGHMNEVKGNEVQGLNFLPHHGIIKSSNNTQKIRVVFDASAKTSTGIFLNDLLMVGPTVQPTLYAIILRFRLHKIAISADVEKMYRQILVKEKYMQYQAIVWRANENEPMRYYKLTTLTYGTAAAPYLATRVLNEIADTQCYKFPDAASALRNCTYVDDLMTGADTVHNAIQLKKQLVHILSNAGMKLKKWVSNSESFIHSAPEEDRTESLKDFTQDGITVKVLGLHWDPKLDVFSYHARMDSVAVLTKRKLLSECSQIFDPLGWLSPVIIKIKIIFQALWLTAVDWDEELPEDVRRSWLLIRDQLQYLERLQIPRWLQTSGQIAELHGFCDASEQAYAAVVYMRHQVSSNDYHCSLVAAKSKVAPIKRISVARLELCGAHLLALLVKSIKEILDINIINTICWTDSTIVLDWLSDVPVRWQTFVGNRTSQILDVVKRDSWRHVPTKNNPADCASQRILPNELLNHCLWWESPSWLRYGSENWPEQRTTYGTTEEERPKFSLAFFAETHTAKFSQELIDKFSSFRKIVTVTAIVQRFVYNAKNPEAKRAGSLSINELEEATIFICKQNQIDHLSVEIAAIKRSEPIKGPLKFLKPFLDENGVMRVGGRTQNSNLPYGTKHPIILPPSKLTRLIIEDRHHRYYHAGAQLILTMLRQKFWLLKGKHEIQQVIRNCLPCFRAKPIPMSQEMGNLPACRVQHVRAFLTVGTDFAGPIQVFHKRGRGQKPVKAYVCLFVCTTTKAVHIEVTTDLSTNTFLAALKRFVARRGLCTDIYSDCGSNYIGADRKLRDIYSILKNSTNEIYHSLLSKSITWHFNPPNAPHFGGLWEAAVKSMKFHLKRVIGETILTLEELQTLLAEIEAILNSRPICGLQNEADIDILTPAHFIIGHSLTLLPEANNTSEKVSPLNRWEMIQQMRQHIWRRWHVEYLTSMQARSKWTSPKQNLSVDDIVLLIDKNLPPTKWLLGRVTQVFPGNDGLVRVATVKTKSGTFRRAIHALCKVPIESDDSRPRRMLETT